RPALTAQIDGGFECTPHSRLRNFDRLGLIQDNYFLAASGARGGIRSLGRIFLAGSEGLYPIGARSRQADSRQFAYAGCSDADTVLGAFTGRLSSSLGRRSISVRG